MIRELGLTTPHTTTSSSSRSRPPAVRSPAISSLAVIGLICTFQAPAAIGPAAFAAPAAATDTPETAAADPTDPPRKGDDGSSLPRRALLRIGTDELRTPNHIRAIAFSPDGRFLAAATQHRVPGSRSSKYGPAGRSSRLVLPGNEAGWVESIAFAPDGRELLWGEQGGEVALWDLSRDRMVSRELSHPAPVSDVKFSADGRLMASAGGDVVWVWPVAKPAELARDLTTRPAAAPGGLDAPRRLRPP